MPYNANIPQANDQLSQSQGDLLGNSTSISTLIGVNHVNFNGGNQGKHKFVEFPIQNPVPVTIGGEVGLYSQTSGITAQPELVFARQFGSTAPAAVQITEFTSAGWTNPGWTKLPSGIMLKWASSVSFAGTPSATVNLNGGGMGPAFTATLTILITPVSTAGFDHVIAISNITFPNFTVTTQNGSNAPATTTFSFLAIGY